MSWTLTLAATLNQELRGNQVFDKWIDTGYAPLVVTDARTRSGLASGGMMAGIALTGPASGTGAATVGRARFVDDGTDALARPGTF